LTFQNVPKLLASTESDLVLYIAVLVGG